MGMRASAVIWYGVEDDPYENEALLPEGVEADDVLEDLVLDVILIGSGGNCVGCGVILATADGDECIELHFAALALEAGRAEARVREGLRRLGLTAEPKIYLAADYS